MYGSGIASPGQRRCPDPVRGARRPRRPDGFQGDQGDRDRRFRVHLRRRRSRQGPVCRKPRGGWPTALLADPKTENRNLFGTPAILALANSSGLLPTRNFSAGSFEKADDIAGERVRQEILSRGGEGRAGQSCVAGCVIKCSNMFPDKIGQETGRVHPVREHLPARLKLRNRQPRRHSRDEPPLQRGGRGRHRDGRGHRRGHGGGDPPFGDAEGAKDLIRQIGQGTYLGRILGNGAQDYRAAAGRAAGPGDQGAGHTRTTIRAASRGTA